jgi:hypothetical protein
MSGRGALGNDTIGREMEELVVSYGVESRVTVWSDEPPKCYYSITRYRSKGKLAKTAPPQITRLTG